MLHLVQEICVDVDKYATRNAKQADHLSGKPRNIRKFNSCQESVWKNLVREKPFIANFKFGTTLVFAGCLAWPVVRISLLVKLS